MIIKTSTRYGFGELHIIRASDGVNTYAWQVPYNETVPTLALRIEATNKLLMKYDGETYGAFYRAGYFKGAVYLFDQYTFKGHVDQGEPVVRTTYYEARGMMTVAMDGVRKQYKTASHLDAVMRLVQELGKDPNHYGYRTEPYKDAHYTLIEGWQ